MWNLKQRDHNINIQNHNLSLQASNLARVTIFPGMVSALLPAQWLLAATLDTPQDGLLGQNVSHRSGSGEADTDCVRGFA